VSKEEAIEILSEIKENINTCCAITMDPDEVLDLIERLEEYIKNE
jgi:3-deoxy-D-arabino-heptulosonate 7-phosphate (DAHP) synthase class II